MTSDNKKCFLMIIGRISTTRSDDGNFAQRQ